MRWELGGPASPVAPKAAPPRAQATPPRATTAIRARSGGPANHWPQQPLPDLSEGDLELSRMENRFLVRQLENIKGHNGGRQNGGMENSYSAGGMARTTDALLRSKLANGIVSRQVLFLLSLGFSSQKRSECAIVVIWWFMRQKTKNLRTARQHETSWKDPSEYPWASLVARQPRQPGRQTSRRRKIFLRRKDNLCDTDGDKGKKDVCA